MLRSKRRQHGQQPLLIGLMCTVDAGGQVLIQMNGTVDLLHKIFFRRWTGACSQTDIGILRTVVGALDDVREIVLIDNAALQ